MKQELKCGDKWVMQFEVDGQIIKNDLIFTQLNGKPMHPNTVDTWFNRFKMTITFRIIQGVDVGTVAKNLGHAKPSTTKVSSNCCS
ncbi:MAG: hypothetical protein ABFD08_14175 [Syntrophomonas sp.]